MHLRAALLVGASGRYCGGTNATVAAPAVRRRLHPPGGLKMKPSADQTSPDVNGPAPPGSGPNRGAIRIGIGSLIGNAASMPLFVRILSQRLQRVVIDQTGLTGRYDFQTQWTPDVGENPLSPAGIPLPAASDAFGPSVFTAIEEQLGLKLTSQKGSVEIYVIDSAEKPSPD